MCAAITDTPVTVNIHTTIHNTLSIPTNTRHNMDRPQHENLNIATQFHDKNITILRGG